MIFHWLWSSEAEEMPDGLIMQIGFHFNDMRYGFLSLESTTESNWILNITFGYCVISG
jgi:hypothetical protein